MATATVAAAEQVRAAAVCDDVLEERFGLLPGSGMGPKWRKFKRRPRGCGLNDHAHGFSGERLYLLRRAAGISRKQIADFLGEDPFGHRRTTEDVRAMEHGKAWPRMDGLDIFFLARYLGVQVIDLYWCEKDEAAGLTMRPEDGK